MVFHFGVLMPIIAHPVNSNCLFRKLLTVVNFLPLIDPLEEFNGYRARRSIVEYILNHDLVSQRLFRGRSV